MEEYLRRVQSRLAADVLDCPIHAVLGGPEPDVDTVAATLCLALHLSQKERSGRVCLPVLCGRPRDAVLPGDTVKYLQRVKISESLLLWREDVDIVKLHHTGKLSLTLLRDGLLDSSEYHTLESSILGVAHRNGQQDAEDDGASSAVTTVAREILQEAAEHIRASLGETLGEALRLQSEALWTKRGRHSAPLEALLDQWSDAAAGQHDEAKLQYWEQLLTVELKEFSDGEMTIALSSVATDKDELHRYVDALKYFCHHHDYDGLVILLSISDTVHHPRQQVVVYSNNTDILNQMCCELEESSSWSLSGELEAKENLQVYHIPINTSSSSGTPSMLEEEIQGLLKDYVDRRSTVLACHPSSRTSSTEGVAGSVEFSQGSSGINDMDGSDIERAEGGGGEAVAIARVITDGEEDTGGVGVNVGGELVSPDSGMTTIRSSRSSKESSVFLSDDSPVGDILAGAQAGLPAGLLLRNPSPLGLLSLSPPVPPERRKHRSSKNRSENIDLFSFDPLHSSDLCMSAGGELANSGIRGDEGERRGGSSSLSELEELSLLDFSAPNSMGELESRNSSIDHHGQIHGNELTDTVVPPTPVNSLVGSRPPSSCGVRFFPEDVIERINGLQHKDSVSSSLSETWDELGFDTQGPLPSNDNNAWNRTKHSESPQNIVEEGERQEPNGDKIEKESREDIFKSENAHQRPKSLEPQLSLITEQTESHDNWNTESVLRNQWHPVTLADLQMTPPEEEVTGKCKSGMLGVKDKLSSFSRKKATLDTLTPETSKEDDEQLQGKRGERQMELLDFWTYSAQKGFLKSDSGTTTSYPESLDMWNMTIRDDSPSPLTTPDNLSENSGSLCRVNSGVGSTCVESPLGFSDGGMQMWNTTIREDSSSTIASPEGPENEKALSHMGSLDASESSKAHANKLAKVENAREKESAMTQELSETHEEVGWRGNEHNVKIVIETAGGRTQEEEMYEQNITFKLSEDESYPDQCANMWDLPVPSMVTSTSEYDNIGTGHWSLTSSPDTYGSPLVDVIQLEGQSSPFIAVTEPVQSNEMHGQNQRFDTLAQPDYRSVISDKEKPANQIFLFEGTSKNRGRGSEDDEWVEDRSYHSPFVLVDGSSATQEISVSYQSSLGEATTQIRADQSSSQCHVDWNSLVSDNHDTYDSTLISHNLSVITDHSEDGPAIESHGYPNNESNRNMEAKIAEATCLSPSSGGERDTLKYSPDSLHSGSRDELRSNSDGDSSSGLEMEYIIVSGTVKETEREWRDRPKQGERHSKGKSMGTFSILSYAATVLQTQAQAAHREHQDNTEQSGLNQMLSDTESTLTLDTEQNQALSTHSQGSPDNTTEQHMVPETLSPSQSEELHKSDSKTGCSQTQVEEGNHDSKSSIVVRSVSPLLRYPVDHFLKTREEVYVHSQISMEDSDEGGQSPSAPKPCPTSLGDFQVWGGQLARQDMPQATSETQSPVLTNSSVSHTSSFVDTPLSESSVSADRGLELPFSGDLMEEENDDEDQEEKSDREHTALSQWMPGRQSEMEERQQLGSSDLLSFTEKVTEGSSLQQAGLQALEPRRDIFLQNTTDYCDGQPVRTVGCDTWLNEPSIGGHQASQDSYSPVLRRCQDITSQLSSHLASDDATYQWTASPNTTQCQTQYGYNYHHIDQRTESQSAHPEGVDPKSNSQPDNTDVYAEFTTDAAAIQFSSEQAGNYHEAILNAEYSLSDPGSKFQNLAEIQHVDNAIHASELQCSECQADCQSHSVTDHTYYQSDGQSFYQSDVQPEREDHARYVPEGYVHFLFSSKSFHNEKLSCDLIMETEIQTLTLGEDIERHSQQEDGAAGMKVASNEEAAEEMDNREDRSGGSNQRRMLVAPPMDVSLDRSEGSLLSEDALDTEDEALDTGDDLDVHKDELDTPDDSIEFNRHGESEDSRLGGASSGVVTGHGAAEACRDGRLWRSVVIGEQEHRIDMKCIEAYKRVISHGGYYAEQNAIIVFAACFLPDSDCDNYNYVMENLFLFVISTLELMVAEDYMIVYLNGATPRRRMPGFTWMKKCYQMIDRRLKKNLKMFIIVHPSWFIRTLLGITRPFISSKFSSKIKYVNSLRELGEIIPMEYVHIPPSIIKLDKDLLSTTSKVDKKGNSAV